MVKKIVCFPVTKWHLYGMLSYLNEMYSEYQVQKLDIDVYSVKHSENGYLLSYNDMPYQNMSFYREEELPIHKKNLLIAPYVFSKKKVESSQVIVMFAKSILVRKMLAYLDNFGLKKNKVQVVLVDDGIGSYLSNKVWEKCSETEGGLSIKTKIKNEIASFIQKRVSASEWHMLSLEDDHLKQLHTAGYLTVIRYDVKKSFELQLKNFKEHYSKKPIAFLVTQPWSETEQLSPTEEKQIISSVIEQLSKKYCVIVKPHPREDKQKYDFKNIVVLGKEYPAEFYLCALEKKDIVVGFNSTALVSAAFIFGLRTYTISDRVAFSNMDNMMKVACKEFLNLTDGTISVLR